MYEYLEIQSIFAKTYESTNPIYDSLHYVTNQFFDWNF